MEDSQQALQDVERAFEDLEELLTYYLPAKAPTVRIMLLLKLAQDMVRDEILKTE